MAGAMTAKQVLDLVEQLDLAATDMLSWLRPGPERIFTYDMRVSYAVQNARIAGRLANRLIDLSEGRPV
jgi:hypothetical protein